ncbi:MAG TPA: hypothetical protein VL948_21485 [Verrucomicrobiae bacterium]|jgi:hypothetical protein|nr:hypothetical protein [Verrucomicrobiae bacterium]
MMPQFGDNEMKVLQAVRRSAMDGYRLLSVTGLKPQALVDALLKLEGVVNVKGELVEGRVGEAYVALPPNNRSFVDMVLAK